MEITVNQESIDEEKEMVQNFAKRIVNSGLETAAIAFLISIYPLTYIGTQLANVVLWPFLDAFGQYGEKTEKLLAFFGKRENINQLIDKIEALSEEKNSKKKE
jgi:hypothetical protein